MSWISHEDKNKLESIIFKWICFRFRAQTRVANNFPEIAESVVDNFGLFISN